VRKVKGKKIQFLFAFDAISGVGTKTSHMIPKRENIDSFNNPYSLPFSDDILKTF
jgi:hypothetical protein